MWSASFAVLLDKHSYIHGLTYGLEDKVRVKESEILREGERERERDGVRAKKEKKISE